MVRRRRDETLLMVAAFDPERESISVAGARAGRAAELPDEQPSAPEPLARAVALPARPRRPP